MVILTTKWIRLILENIYESLEYYRNSFTLNM